MEDRWIIWDILSLKSSQGLHLSKSMQYLRRQTEESSYAESSKLPPWSCPPCCHTARAIPKIAVVTNWNWYFLLLLKALKPDRYSESLIWTDGYEHILIKNASYFWRKKVKEQLFCLNLHIIKFLVVAMSNELEAVCFKSITACLCLHVWNTFLKKILFISVRCLRFVSEIICWGFLY